MLMIDYFINRRLKYYSKKFNESEIRSDIKRQIKFFFEGFRTSFDNVLIVDPVIEIPISKLEITDIKFEVKLRYDKNNGSKSHVIEVTIVSNKPELIIGRACRIIKRLEKYINENVFDSFNPFNKTYGSDIKLIKLNIKESKLWE